VFSSGHLIASSGWLCEDKNDLEELDILTVIEIGKPLPGEFPNKEANNANDCDTGCYGHTDDRAG